MGTISKNPEQFAENLLPLLRHVSTLLFVDPHYVWWDKKLETTKLSWAHASVAKAIALRMSTEDVARVPRQVEFHMLSVSDSAGADLEVFCRKMSEQIPRDWKVSAFMWSELPDGKRFHARYILTNLGGLGCDYGLDAGRSKGDETDLYLLTESMLIQRTTDFSIDGKVFNLVAGPMGFQGIRPLPI